MSKPAAEPKYDNVMYQYPGITASILTVIVGVGFIGLLYMAVKGH